MAAKRITARFLISAGACASQVQRFHDLWPRGIVPTAALALEYAGAFDWRWAAANLLSDSALVEYERMCAPTGAEYDRARAAAWAEYERVCTAARAEYDRARGAEYERVCAPARAEYDRVRAAARAEYERVCALAFVGAWANGF
ncbi:MAG: hypothetical protein A3E01_07765 [Gammaproteobacteria bacterium RIFCSPHIGHO2_12_FULL_63_22]|nr:MAG: hypothetical protein A3E01_07765 [Gammaproteobacteria bacterium RIFCSPHIGHO2_12_FULL_63_22]